MGNNGNERKEPISRAKRWKAVLLDRLDDGMIAVAVQSARLAPRLFSRAWVSVILMALGFLLASLGNFGIIQPGPSVWAFWLYVAVMVLGLLMVVYGIILWVMPVCHFHLPGEHNYDHDHDHRHEDESKK
ncbi:MAG: hypothetical protein ACYCQL_03685 [Acidithiobacillus sp.]